MRVPQVDVIALFSPELLFHHRLQAGLPDIVSRLVFRMLFDIVRIYFGDVAEQVPSRVERIFADASDLRPETRKTVFLLCEPDIGVRLYKFEKRQSLIANLILVFGVVGHPAAYEIYGGVK